MFRWFMFTLQFTHLIISAPSIKLLAGAASPPGRGRANGVQMPSIYSDTVRGRGRTSNSALSNSALSNSLVDVGFRVGSAAGQDQEVADILRECETRRETIDWPRL